MNRKWKIFRTLSLIIKKIFCFVLNIIRCWGAVDFKICLAPKYHGYSISAQSYEFYPHMAQLDNLDFTMPCKTAPRCESQTMQLSPQILSHFKKKISSCCFPKFLGLRFLKNIFSKIYCLCPEQSLNFRYFTLTLDYYYTYNT